MEKYRKIIRKANTHIGDVGEIEQTKYCIPENSSEASFIMILFRPFVVSGWQQFASSC